jgi:peptidoglycan-associated lipoprotein
MRQIALAALSAAALVLAACATTSSDTAAPVEGSKPPADVQTQPVKPVDVTGTPGGAGSPLKDPKNILSKRSIFYDYDKFDVRDEYRPMVEAHAKYLRENPSARMLIQGNTDERGSREYNVGLGQRRSDAVKRMLILLGARDNQIESVSLGEEKPMSEGHDESAWSKNRRSDMLYSGEY